MSAAFCRIKVVPRSFVLFRAKDLYFLGGVFLGYILAVIGGIFTYASKKIIKDFNINPNKEIYLKLFGYTVALIGCLIIMDII